MNETEFNPFKGMIEQLLNQNRWVLFDPEKKGEE